MPNDAVADGASLSELLRQLKCQPRPLLFGPGRLGIIWSPKSACTTVLLWYLWHCDLLQAALSFNPWPHEFRMRVLYRSETYRAWRAELSTSGWSWLRVVRDPFVRAVSSYRHALQNGYEDRRMAHVLRRPVDSKHGYSFEQFLDYLLRIDISTCDGHLRQQFHPVETLVTPTQTVNIAKQDLMACLRKIDETLPPPRQPAAALHAAIAGISSSHHARQTTVDGDQAATAFTAAQTWGEWPSHRHFLNASTRDKIATIYAGDFTRYADYF